MKERLQKILARAGISSRRKAEEMISEGRVCVNGVVVLELGSKADAGHDVIELDGMAIGAAENKVYVMLHKPAGYITTMSDPEGRPTVMNIVSGIPERIVPVGRLDYDTEGLLILTNDGDFSQLLQHPRFQIERCYRVKVRGIPSPAVLEKLMAGVYIDNVKTNRCKIKVLDRLDKNAWLEVRLKEGRNRQLRRMFESVGHDAIRILRVGFGPLELGSLAVGAFRFMNKKEIEAIKAFVKAPPPKSFRKPKRKSAEKGTSGKPAGWAVSKHVRKPAEKGTSGKPAGWAVSKHGRKPAEKSTSGKPAGWAVSKHVRKPADKSTSGKPAGWAVRKPGRKPQKSKLT